MDEKIHVLISSLHEKKNSEVKESRN